jgi:hypothetical protein
MTRQLRPPALFTLLAAMLMAIPTFAAEPRAPFVWIDACPGVETGTAPGLWLSLPNDDGSLRRQIAEEQARKRLDPNAVRGPLDRSSDGLTLVIHPDGMKSIRLEGRFQDALVARVATDGSPQMLCTDSAEEAQQFTSGTASQPGPKPEEK